MPLSCALYERSQGLGSDIWSCAERTADRQVLLYVQGGACTEAQELEEQLAKWIETCKTKKTQTLARWIIVLGMRKLFVTERWLGRSQHRAMTVLQRNVLAWPVHCLLCCWSWLVDWLPLLECAFGGLLLLFGLEFIFHSSGPS